MINSSYARLCNAFEWDTVEYATRHLYLLFRQMCIWRKYKWQVACSTVSHEKALHNCLVPCLNLRKIYGRFRNSSQLSGNFRKVRKRFKPIFGERRKKQSATNDIWAILTRQQKSMRALMQTRKSISIGLIVRRSWKYSELISEKASKRPHASIIVARK